MSEILVNQGVLFFIVIDVHAKAMTVSKFSFELSRQVEE